MTTIVRSTGRSVARSCSRFVLFTAIGGAVVSVSGCLVGPNYVPPEIELPTTFLGAKGTIGSESSTPPDVVSVEHADGEDGTEAPPALPAAVQKSDGNIAPEKQSVETTPEGSVAPAGSQSNALAPSMPVVLEAREIAAPAPADWWKLLNDPVLNRLIDEAIASNLDLRTAASRVREAREELTIARGQLLPSLSGAFDATRERPSGVNPIANSSSMANPIPTTPRNLFNIGFDAAWELDVFGGIRRQAESVEASYQSQVEAERGALVTLLGEVAQNYVMLRGAQQQLGIALRNVDTQNDTVDIQRTKFGAGVASDLTVAQAEAQLASTNASVPTFETQIRQAMHRLAILINREPEALLSELEPVGTIPVGPEEVPPGLPSDLLRRRPDIRQAEREVAMATAEIGVATADLFPKFNLTGEFGWESRRMPDALRGSGRFWSIGSAVTIPLFFDSRLHAYVRIREHRQEQAILAYRKTVLGALSEVEDSLVAYNREQKRRAFLKRAVEANQRALDQARLLYDAGVADFLNVLTAQQALFQSETELATSEIQVSTNLVALYKALGGGWEDMLNDEMLAQS